MVEIELYSVLSWHEQQNRGLEMSLNKQNVSLDKCTPSLVHNLRFQEQVFLGAKN